MWPIALSEFDTAALKGIMAVTLVCMHFFVCYLFLVTLACTK